jgi:hypothetical protein
MSVLARMAFAARRALTGRQPAGVLHVLFCKTDHFEPVAARRSTAARERARMRTWLTEYPRLAQRHWDSDGVPPQHTFFYPAEAYRPEYLDQINELVAQGLGEIELHLHHGHDTSASLRAKIERGLDDFNRHGALLTRETPARRTYAFIHGNLALDNGLGDPRFCGVDDELTVLQETGCYADFSMPTAPEKSQARKTNAIYYAIDDPLRAKSYDSGEDAAVGRKGQDGLLMITGPVGSNWRQRKLGIFPRLDIGEITGPWPGTPDRIARWVRAGIHVKGRPEWIVVKVSCHGAEERSFDALLGGAADRMHATLEAHFRDRRGYRLHYVTARQLYNIVKAAEAGCEGDPDEYRDFIIPPYENMVAARRSGEGRGSDHGA